MSVKDTSCKEAINMEYHGIEIDEKDEDEKVIKLSKPSKTAKHITPKEASSSNAKDYCRDEDMVSSGSGTMLSSVGDEDEVLRATESWRLRRDAFEFSFGRWKYGDDQHPQPDLAGHLGSSDASYEYSFALIERHLEEWRGGGRRSQGPSSSVCIFRLPHSLAGIDPKAEQPEVVSIGPFHRGKDHLLEFEHHKWYFLDKFLKRTKHFGADLSTYVRWVRALEEQSRASYSENIVMSSHDFTEMLLLDACFVVELLRHLGKSEDVVHKDDPIFNRPWLIPILLRDLLKLENQLPFFVPESLFNWSTTGDADEKQYYFSELALKVFDLAFPRPLEIVEDCRHLKGKHLLHLFHSSLLPQNRVPCRQDPEKYSPSEQSIQCVTQLRQSGIKFKQRKSAASFLDINFRKRALEIPPITITDFTTTVLINCIAMEQCEENSYNYFTGYAAFMSCLINQPRDVAFLCSDGIITRFSRDDQYVADLFNHLRKGIAFNIRDCYLGQQFKEVEACYSSNWAVMVRTYFSSPWSAISVFSAFTVIVLTMVQTVMSILSYQRQYE